MKIEYYGMNGWDEWETTKERLDEKIKEVAEQRGNGKGYLYSLRREAICQMVGANGSYPIYVNGIGVDAIK